MAGKKNLTTETVNKKPTINLTTLAEKKKTEPVDKKPAVKVVKTEPGDKKLVKVEKNENSDKRPKKVK